MATKKERSSFLLQTPSTSCTISHESHCKYVGADTLEMDTRKEKGGQGSAENKLSLTSRSSSDSTVFLFFSLPLSLMVSQIFVLGQTFSGCAGTFTIVLEKQRTWTEAQGSLRNSKVPRGSLNNSTPFLAGKDTNLFSPEKGTNITHNDLGSVKPRWHFHCIWVGVSHPRQRTPFVKLPLTDGQILDPPLRNFSGHYFENQNFMKFSFLSQEMQWSRKIFLHVMCQFNLYSQ